MPDFPKSAGGGATAAEVWAYATRKLTGLDGTPRSDLLGEDATFEAGVGARKVKIDNVDALVSSRSSHVASDIWAVATRQLTAITGTPRSDLLGEDATFEAGTGARKIRIDKIPAALASVESSVVMDGTEKTLIEITDVKVGHIEVWVDLTPMVGGDTIVIRYWKKIKAAGSYAKYAEETYSGAQTIPLLDVLNKGAYRDTKVTAQQTVGTNRTLDVQVIRTREA
jgi:hypothetical protein